MEDNTMPSIVILLRATLVVAQQPNSLLSGESLNQKCSAYLKEPPPAFSSFSSILLTSQNSSPTTLHLRPLQHSININTNINTHVLHRIRSANVGTSSPLSFLFHRVAMATSSSWFRLVVSCDRDSKASCGRSHQQHNATASYH
jgi:hypothetical protein